MRMTATIKQATIAITLLGLAVPMRATGEEPAVNARRPSAEADLKYWLQNMVGDHGFSDEEAAAATGIAPGEIKALVEKFGVKPGKPSPAARPGLLRVIPYPGGRHPRIGFLDGAVNPQRETKVSVFTPWDPASYVVVDVPEAIWSNLGLTYLAHTHVPTVWTKQGVELPRLEWARHPDGVLESTRTLPNGVKFAARVVPRQDGVAMRLTLTNGTEKTLTDLRVQQCVMLKGAKGFEAQSNANKVFHPPYSACRSADGRHWVITAWEPIQRAWGNAQCPCLHSDPKFPDCPPGETRTVTGWLSFHEGDDVEPEFQRLDQTGWRDAEKLDAPGLSPAR